MSKSHWTIAHEWAHGKDLSKMHHWLSSSRSNVWHHDGVLVSYATPIAARIIGKNGEPVFVLDRYGYSVSTSKHQYIAGRAIPVDARKVSFPFYHTLYGSCRWDAPNNDELVREIIRIFENKAMSILDGIPTSRTLLDEKDFVDVCTKWSGIKVLHGWVCTGKLIEMVKDCKVAKYLYYHKDAEFAQIASALLGKKVYLEYFARTMPARKAACTRDGIPFVMPSMSSYTEEQIKMEVAQYRKDCREENVRKREEEERRNEKLRAKWYAGGNGGFFNASKEFFHGGNVLMRIKDGRIETSKGIKLTIDEGHRLWKLIKSWHESGAQIPYSENARTLMGVFRISSYVNDILTAGCHQIAFPEMERVAKELQFDGTVETA